MWSESRPARQEPLSVLGRLFVSPSARGHRFGRRLTQRVMDAARETQHTIVLNVMDKDTTARHFYESIGWVEIGKVTHRVDGGRRLPSPRVRVLPHVRSFSTRARPLNPPLGRQIPEALIENSLMGRSIGNRKFVRVGRSRLLRGLYPSNSSKGSRSSTCAASVCTSVGVEVSRRTPFAFLVRHSSV